MLNMNRIALLIPLTLLVLCALGSCRASRMDSISQEPGTGTDGGAVQPSFGAFLPSPSALLPLLEAEKRVSYAETDYIRNGKDYLGSLPHPKAAISGNDAMFTPTWSESSKTAADLGYCIYGFDNVSSFGRACQLTYGWTEPPSDIGTAWLGVANWERDRWDWYQCNEEGVQDLPGLSFLPYTSVTDQLLAVMLLANDETSGLRYMRLGQNMVNAQLTVSPMTSLDPIDVNASAAASTTIIGTLDLFEWDWDGDDIFEEDTGATAAAQHTYHGLGDHRIQVRVTSSYGERDHSITTANVIEPWTHSMGGSAGDHIEAIANDGDRNIYAAGYTMSYGVGSSDVLLLKYSPSGELYWAKTWGGTGSDVAYAMCIADGDIYLAGFTSSFGVGGNDILLQHWDSEGTHLGSRTWGGTEYDHATSIATRGDYVYVAGLTDSYGVGMLDGVLLQYDLDNNLQWQRTWGGADDEQFQAVTTSYHVISATTHIHVTGYTDSITTGRDVLYLRYLTDGTLSTQRTWKSEAEQIGYCIKSYGFFSDTYIGGTIGSGLSHDLLLIRTGTDPFALRWSTGIDEMVTGMHCYGNTIVLSGTRSSLGSGSWAFLASFSSTGALLGTDNWGITNDNDSFNSICGFAKNGVLAAGSCAKAEGGTWFADSGTKTNLLGVWDDQTIVPGTPTGSGLVPLGTKTDITDAIIDTGGGGSDALISLHHIPPPP